MGAHRLTRPLVQSDGAAASSSMIRAISSNHGRGRGRTMRNDNGHLGGVPCQAMNALFSSSLHSSGGFPWAIIQTMPWASMRSRSGCHKPRPSRNASESAGNRGTDPRRWPRGHDLAPRQARAPLCRRCSGRTTGRTSTAMRRNDARDARAARPGRTVLGTSNMAPRSTPAASPSQRLRRELSRRIRVSSAQRGTCRARSSS